MLANVGDGVVSWLPQAGPEDTRAQYHNDGPCVMLPHGRQCDKATTALFEPSGVWSRLTTTSRTWQRFI